MSPPPPPKLRPGEAAYCPIISLHMERLSVPALTIRSVMRIIRVDSLFPGDHKIPILGTAYLMYSSTSQLAKMLSAEERIEPSRSEGQTKTPPPIVFPVGNSTAGRYRPSRSVSHHNRPGAGDATFGGKCPRFSAAYVMTAVA